MKRINHISDKETHSQVNLDKFSFVPSIERTLCLPSGTTRQIEPLSFTSAHVVLLQSIPEKEKPQSFIYKFRSSSFFLSFFASLPLPIFHLVVTIWSLYHLHPVCKPSYPTTHFCSAPCPFLLPLLFLLSHYEPYYFDPSHQSASIG